MKDSQMECGCIEFHNLGVTVVPGMRENAFLESSLGANATPLVHNGEYRSYSAGRHLINDRLFAVSVFFESGILRSVHLSPIDPTVANLADLTEEKLQEQTAGNQQWLSSGFGVRPPAVFSWGKIEATTDMKSPNAAIVLSYDTPFQ